MLQQVLRTFFIFCVFVTYCEEATTCVLLPFFPLFNSDLIFPTLFSAAAELPVVLATVEQKLIELTTLTNLEGKCDFSFVTISATGKKLEIIQVLMI